MNATMNPAPRLIATVAVDCPWCEQTMLTEAPLPDRIRCDACSIEVEMATEIRGGATAGTPREPVLPRAA